MEGGSNGTSCMMAFGENSNNGLVCPMMMMMPLITTTSTISTTSSPSHSHHHHHHHNQHHHQHHNHSPNPNISDTTNMISSVFLPLPHNHHHHNRNSTSTTTGSSSLNNNNNNNNMLDNHHHNNNNNNNNNNISTSTYFHMVDHDDHNHQINTTTTTTDHCNTSVSSFKAKIMAHPHYQRLLASYVNCQKVGAPPEVVARLEAACGSAAAAAMGHVSRGCLGEDPALDQFMEAYCEMLSKYEQELSKPFKEAMLFLQRIESQFKSLTVSSSDSACGEAVDRNGSSEEEVDVNNSFIDPQAEDRELKGQLLRKYSGYLGSLKQEFMKKRKKGKLPKEARQQLLDWWSRHYKWPYPSESQKLALAESTGLDQKQINNWFINQRKRHWKPSEDMQLVVMDAANPHHYYMESILGNPFPMDISPQLL